MDERVTSQMTEQEVNRYKELFDENQKLVIMAGILKLQEFETLAKEDELKENFNKYLNMQSSLRNDLEIKYGKGYVDSEKWVYVKEK